MRMQRLIGDTHPQNPYYLDETILAHFREFCSMAQEHGFQLIVGLITGWMSGRLFVPPAIYGRNIYSDPTALKFQQLFIKGFVGRFKDEPCIIAWDLGNECNEMGRAQSADEAYNWASLITNAIRAADSTRIVISGMHSLEIDGIWNIQDQGEITDMLTTHPYPYWVKHGLVDHLDTIRTLMHATAETQYYASVSKKPCLVEELGYMGPMVASDELGAGFMRVNLFSNWANGAKGLLWWCANEQSHLSTPPYEWNMFERELGMLDCNMQPKPILQEMKKFADLLETLQLDLPRHRSDGVCILTWDHDHWGAAFMSYVMAKQAGLTLDFAYCEQELPESDFYLLPSIAGEVMSKTAYERLKQKVADGATVYISMNNGILTEFEDFTGVRVQSAHALATSGTMKLSTGEMLPYHKEYDLRIEATHAKVLAVDESGAPFITEAGYGKGRVIFVNCPFETMLLQEGNIGEKGYYAVYSELFKDRVQMNPVHSENAAIGLTLHQTDGTCYAVAVNYSAQAQNTALQWHSTNAPKRVLYGNLERIPPFDAVIFEI